MNKDDIKRKLTSRKFWLSVTSFVSMLIIYNGGSENKAAQVAALIMAGASVLGYLLGEGLADAANIDCEIEQVVDIEQSEEDSDE